MNVPFILRTTDAAWTARHNGADAGDGRVTVMLPADQVEITRFAGTDWLKHKFADCPKDIPNALVLCPLKWVTA
jgi:hypothetical protein